MSNDARPGPPPEWTPRLWQGCNFPAFARLLVRNRFAVHPRFLHIPFVVTTVSLGHSVLHYLQEAVYGSRLDRTPIRHPPVFIIGHWRTGTTLLHELLTLDPRHSYPTTYCCLEPNHFLLTEGVVKRFFRWMLPSHRPMDNMKVGWDQPQEEEFALCMLGQPSPYLTIAFPNRPPQDQDAFDVESLPPRARDQWKRAFVGLLRRLTYRDPRRLVLKSPTHSWRIPTLLELFPGARFVHIVRNPYVVFSSTVNLWRTLYRTHGLQVPNFRGLEEHVFTTFTHLYDRLEATRHLVPDGDFYELKYEDLIAAPVDRMAELYDRLGLGEFDALRPRLEAYLRENAGYQTNRYPPLSDDLRGQIARRWAPVIERYGYAPPPG
ncbi:MAG: sulfotransferase [Gemmataceae bacterium]